MQPIDYTATKNQIIRLQKNPTIEYEFDKTRHSYEWDKNDSRSLASMMFELIQLNCVNYGIELTEKNINAALDELRSR